MSRGSRHEVKDEAVRRELLPGQSVELLRELHLVGRDGALHADSLRKLKQVNHLVQLLEPALRDTLQRHPDAVLVDAGAGNAYLGFVLYELFLSKSAGVLYSVETRPDLVQRAMERAQRLHYERMRFLRVPLAELSGPVSFGGVVRGGGASLYSGGRAAAGAPEATPTASDVASADPSKTIPERVHLVTALHACDTATDDAILLGLRRNADHIAVVPCCQAEVAAQLKSAPHAASAPWPLLWQHPIHRREAGAHLTNVLRALVLESQGYQVTVTELTGWEHSLKNELILARRVHKESRPALARLHELLAATKVRPKLVRELFPDAPPGELAAFPAASLAASPADSPAASLGGAKKPEGAEGA